MNSAALGTSPICLLLVVQEARPNSGLCGGLGLVGPGESWLKLCEFRVIIRSRQQSQNSDLSRRPMTLVSSLCCGPKEPLRALPNAVHCST